MALPAVGSQISLSQIQTEWGGSNPIQLSEYYGKGNASASGQITMSGDFGGTTAPTEITSSAQEITVSNYISSGETLQINSGVYIWSDSTSTAGMTINIPCTIINNGYIIGRGGNGFNLTDNNGGPAINVTSSGVTIINNSGAFIAGGGGGGGRGRNGVGGGGAGGGSGGAGGGTAGAGGSIGNSGSNGSGTGSGFGGGAGGGGSATTFAGTGAGGGGGRILPGTGGAGGSNSGPGGAGGSGGNPGSNASNVGGDMGGGGGGGGWGAPGGVGYYPTSSANPGGSGGAAITGTSRTLTNNGTIYGST